MNTFCLFKKDKKKMQERRNAYSKKTKRKFKSEGRSPFAKKFNFCGIKHV